MRFIRLTAMAVLTLAACSDGPNGPGVDDDDTVSTIQITPASPSVDEGGTVALAAVAKNAAGATVEGTSFTWTSTNPAIATVGQSTGLVTGVLAGTTQITATGG